MASGNLEVLLVECKEIRENLNPYVVVRYGNQERTSNVARVEEKKSVWNETLKFNAVYPGGEDHKYKLTFHIMDKHEHEHEPKAKDEFVGESVIYVKDVVSIGVEKGEKELRLGKHRVVLPDKTYAGEISVAVTFKLPKT